MRKLVFWGLLLFVVTLISIPALIVHGLNLDPVQDQAIQTSKKVKVYFVSEKIVRQIPIDEYLIGVVAAEMPANFEIEALKAQAIAARTYTLKRIEGKKTDYPQKAVLCTDYRHCQAWESFTQLKKKWGVIGYYRNLKKIKKAVLETRDIAIVYEGKLIDPLYHSSCGGFKTENSEEVWGTYLPYLRSVKCQWEENKKVYSLAFSFQEFGQKVFGKKNYAIENIKSEMTSTGRIKNLIINGEVVSATELRTKLGLRSTLFSWQLSNKIIKLNTFGNGHGVGLCQFGANGLAKKGMTYKQILKYYYNGIELVNL